MGDLVQLLRLFEVGRMGRRDLERLVAELDEDGRGGASLDELEPLARAASNVGYVESVLDAASRSEGSADGAGATRPRKRAVAIDWDAYERDRALLDGLVEERAAREELREAARGRLRHFEKRDGYLYRPAGSTPLERYQAALRRRK